MVISKIWIRLSAAAAILMGWVSLLGITQENTYSQEMLNWAAQAIGQDYINLFLAAPALLISAYFAGKGSLKAYLIWLGILIYMIYSYLLYSFFIHFGPNFLFYVAILALSFYSLAGSLMELDVRKLSESFSGVNTGYAGFLLSLVGFMFYFLWLRDITGALSASSLPAGLFETGLPVNPVHVLDMSFVLPGAILTAILLKKRKLAGFLFAVPMLVFFAVMGIAIMAMFISTFQKGFSFAGAQMIIMGIIVLAALASSYRLLGQIKQS